MRSLAIALLSAGLLGCAILPASVRRQPPVEDALYRRALVYLDPANQRGSLDSARVLLDRYLASNAKKAHLGEAIAIRRLIDEAQELERTETMLHQLLATATEQQQPPSRADADSKTPLERPQTTKRASEPRPRPSAQAAREIQRLRQELREANAELERIRKRLAEPKP